MTRPAKPIIVLDASLPRTYDYPHKQGKPWDAKMRELRALGRELVEASNEKSRAEVMALIHDAREDVTFKPVPYFAQNVIMMGANATRRAFGEPDIDGPVRPSGWVSCHPDTWAAVPEKTKAHFHLHDTQAIFPET